jgi:hypothetical protein
MFIGCNLRATDSRRKRTHRPQALEEILRGTSPDSAPPPEFRRQRRTNRRKFLFCNPATRLAHVQSSSRAAIETQVQAAHGRRRWIWPVGRIHDCRRVTEPGENADLAAVFSDCKLKPCHVWRCSNDLWHWCCSFHFSIAMFDGRISRSIIPVRFFESRSAGKKLFGRYSRNRRGLPLAQELVADSGRPWLTEWE